MDMFCGSGTVPLEAARLGRRVLASDSSRYAIVLTKGKLYAPDNEETATTKLERIITDTERLPLPDLQDIPAWVQSFFHPLTLRETLRLAHVLSARRHYFYLASLLGILHHQRPGFLSYPSSHLVPYLRPIKFPREEYPELYDYRAVPPRLQAKIGRALRRPPETHLRAQVVGVRLSAAQSLTLPADIDCVLTSPPYMNALDYQRDNRLRLWLLRKGGGTASRDRGISTDSAFRSLMVRMVSRIQEKLRLGGHCIFVVGERTARGKCFYPCDVLAEVVANHGSRLQLIEVINDTIPDVRRSRRDGRAVKRENILVFRRTR